MGANVGFNPHEIGVSASLLPGVMVTKKTMIYARLGIIGNSYLNNQEKFIFGVQPGMGVQTQISSHWDARIEYTTQFASIYTSHVSIGLVYKF